MANLTDYSSIKSFSAYDELPISYSVRFWLFVVSDTLSILCGLFVLYHLLFTKTLRQGLSNHPIIALLLVNLTFECVNIPLIINFYRLDGVWQITRPYTQIWQFLQFPFFATETIVFAWCCVERHIVIFHEQWLNSRRKRFVFHYLPFIMIHMYCLIYYALIVFYPFCEYLPYQSTIIGVTIPCFLVDPILSKYDLIMNQIIPVIVILISTFGLLFRFIKQRTRLRLNNQWRKHRKLVIQVLLIFIVFCGFQFPWTILQLCNLFGLALNSLDMVKNYMLFFGYYICFLLPIVSCGTLPNLKTKLKTFFCCQNQ